MWFKTTTLTISPATVADAALLAALHQANFAHGWKSADFTSLILDPHVLTLVARHSNPIGFLMMREAAGESEILSIAVLKKHQGQGIATKLIKAIWSQLALKKVEEVFLEVASTNAPALKLYANLGFKEVGMRKSYYGAGENALILKRKL